MIYQLVLNLVNTNLKRLAKLPVVIKVCAKENLSLQDYQ